MLRAELRKRVREQVIFMCGHCQRPVPGETIAPDVWERLMQNKQLAPYCGTCKNKTWRIPAKEMQCPDCGVVVKSTVLDGRVHRHQKPDKTWCETQFTFGDATADFEKYLLQWMYFCTACQKHAFAAEFFGPGETKVPKAKRKCAACRSEAEHNQNARPRAAKTYVCVECEQELPSIMFSGHQKDVFDQNLRTCEVCASADASQRKDTLPCHICSHPTDVRFLLAKMRQNLSRGHTTLLCPDCRRDGFTKKNETGKNCAKCLQNRPTCAYLERSDR